MALRQWLLVLLWVVLNVTCRWILLVLVMCNWFKVHCIFRQVSVIAIFANCENDLFAISLHSSKKVSWNQGVGLNELASSCVRYLPISLVQQFELSKLNYKQSSIIDLGISSEILWPSTSSLVHRVQRMSFLIWPGTCSLPTSMLDAQGTKWKKLRQKSYLWNF